MTGADLQLELAYRLGESSVPSDAAIKAQRYKWLTKGYFNISRRRNWWWQEASSTTNVNTGSTSGYPEPADLKEFIELKINNIYYDQIPYPDNRIYQGTSAVVSLPTLRRSFIYYRFAGKYYLIPTDSADGAVHNIKYWKRVSAITADSDAILIPDEYSEALTAYAEGEYWMSITQQAKAMAPFQLFEEIVQQMQEEHSRRGWGASGFSILDPEDALDKCPR